ncbi:hypothetical protein [Pseudomonas sp. GZD-222]|uniref:hypothetical protein n=1 Tax=Pseudomonas sp. GZD-222 TaxID=3404805 RepID=UPI003BB6CF64
MGIKEKLTAKQARALSRALRMSTLDDLDNPVFNVANPLLPDTVDDDPNQLHKDIQGTNLILDIPVFDQGADNRPGRITLYWQGNAIGTPHAFTTPIAPGDFPVPMTLPASATQAEGSFNLHYDVNIRGNISQSLPMAINIDKTAPNGGQPGGLVTLPAEVEANGITRAYLDANGNKVVVTVDGNYTDAKIGDVVEVWYGISIPLATKVGEVTRANLADPVTFDLLEAMLGEEGEKSLFYKLADRKGNIGPDSQYKRVNVELTAPPAALRPPRVPLAGDGLIDYADVVAGVRVFIDPYTNWFSRDLVVVTFDGTDHAPQQMPQSGADILLPYALVFGGNLGEKDSRVTYRIVRGSNSFPEQTGLAFKVDLRTPGPDPEDPPKEVHPALNVPVVKGAVSPENQLRDADRNQPVNATALIYAGSAVGEYVQLYWNGVLVPGARYDIDGSEADDFPMPFVIPWATIDAAGNGDIPCHYVLKHGVNDNELSSAARTVDVEGVPIVVPTPAFLNLDLTFPPDQILNCPALRVDNGVLVAEIEVPAGDARLAGQLLTFTYQGWSDEAGTVPIDDTIDTFDYTPSVEEAENGFVVQLPYETALKETRQAYGSIHYTVDIGGVTVDSPRHLVIVELWRPGGFFCEIPTPPARR